MKNNIASQFSPHTITGQVLPGLNKGKDTGARTANLDPILAKDLPKGLYSCEVKIDKKEYSGLLYYGYNSISKIGCLEVHILDFNNDIYGQIITVTTKKFLRPEKIFQDIKSLKKQIDQDLKEAKK